MLQITLSLLLASSVVFAQSKSGGPNREKINNEFVRVLIANSPPGAKSRLHKHDVNRVMVYLDDGAQQLKFADGTVKDQKWKAGDVILDPKGGMHTSENKHSQPFRIVEIELKKPGESVKLPALDPVKVDPSHYKVLLETEQVRVIRTRFAAGDRVAMHEHALPRVVIFFNDYQLGVTNADGQFVEVKGDAGDVIMAGPGKHSETNRTSGMLDIIAVEIKAKPGA